MNRLEALPAPSTPRQAGRILSVGKARDPSTGWVPRGSIRAKDGL
ncbi:MAG: hypothetical protein ACE5GG_05790 [Candidatus Omnitrophota bacterium]